ncbi:MAG: UDP-N-acetylmuramate dehydrogenase [Phycisphaerae bacterium]|nr:UDP-N-acetylmuramate dehydrogenase [Phycisphaerae bacterium]NUQ45265.1 UDP-N-acetylmuramate dehydrogenase [Phycisphaerae bacterium]
MNWFDDFSDIVRADVPLAPFTWYRLGGPARWLVEPRDERQLAAVLRRCRDAGVETRMLGKGANLLVSDEGVDAAVIRLSGPAFEDVAYEGRRVVAGAGADLVQLVKATAHRGLAGLEGLAGIPATVGGAVRMNCGGKYGEIGERVRSVRVVTRDGELFDRTDVRFEYRRTDLNGDCVVAATLELTPADPAATYALYRAVYDEKTAAQPRLGERSAGCVFKNPSCGKAGQLIDECGLKGAQRGGAIVSPRHANFIVAQNGATARDVLELIRHVQRTVADRRGVMLELEVEVWSPEGAPMPGCLNPDACERACV